MRHLAVAIVCLFLAGTLHAAADQPTFAEACAAGLRDAGETTFLKAIGVHRTGDCAVVEKAVRASTALDLAFKGVKDIALIAHFPHLETLELNGNPVKSLEPLRALTKLRVLVLYGRVFTTIDALKALRDLEELTLDGSAVSSFEPLRGLPKLRELYFREAPKLKDIAALKEMPALKVLYVHSTSWRTFP